jgi:protein O-mannosyl-transferase
MRKRISERSLFAGICVFLAAIVWFVFGQTASFPFINFDDPEYVYEVPEINAGLTLHGIKWAFTHVPSTNWFPLKNISHMLEFQFYGSNAGEFHLTNVILHALAVLLLFLVLRQMTGGPSRTDNIWPSAFVAALFAIHPLRVESVAWIEERKDVLSGVFFMLTLAAYAHYTRKPSAGRYVTMSILFACGLLSKPMLVTTPLVLLLLDYWPLNRGPAFAKATARQAEVRHGESVPRRIRSQRFATANPSFGGSEVGGQTTNGQRWLKLIVEKIPLFVLSAAVAILTSLGIAPAHSAADQMPFLGRIANAFVSYVVYIWQMIWPARLAVFHPYPQTQLPIWQVASALLLLIAITIAVFALRRTRPYLLVGWLWYLLMLAPVIGIVQINLQAHADRYTYLPQIGLYVLIAWAIADLSARWRYRRQIVGVAAIVVIAALAWAARVQASYWRDSETLWNHTIAVTNDNYFAHASLADLLMRRGRVREAIAHSEEALRIRPRDADAQNNLGLALLQIGDTSAAVTHLRKSLEIDPGQMNAEVNLAWILATAQDSSMRDGARAVELAEDVARRAGHPNAVVLRTLAAAYAESGRFSEAIGAAEQARQLAVAQGNAGLAQDLQHNINNYRMNLPVRSY